MSIETAIKIALDAHKGQVDKGGQPYILHPLRVMMAMDCDLSRIVAVLHDVIEDSDVTPGQLFVNGIEGRAVDAIMALTRLKDETYEEFIERVALNPLATKVKLADLADNMDVSRLGREMTKSDWKRHDRYGAAKARLLNL